MGNDILTHTCIGLFLFSMVACGGVIKGRKDFVSTNIEHAAAQYGLQIETLEK